MASNESRIDELRLVEDARRGSDEAFCSLLRLHQGRVRSFVACHVRAWDVVDDLSQEIFLSAYRNLADYRAESSFGHWVLGIARLKILMHFRESEHRRSRQSGSFEAILAGFQAERLQPEAEVPEAHERKLLALEQCLGRLPEDRARLVTEYYSGGSRSEELARHYGKTGGALRMTILKIRQALRECIRLRLSESG